jgi:hypothetical protein
MTWIFLNKNNADEYIEMFAAGSQTVPTCLETWRYEDPSTPRFTGGLGIVRPLAAVSYNDNLLISGHRGNIANQKTIPTV